MDNVVIILWIILLIAWFAAPFELYGINSKLEKILTELKKMNGS